MFLTDAQPIWIRIIRGFAILEHGTLETPTEDHTLTVYYSPAIEARIQFDRETRDLNGTGACRRCLRWTCRCRRRWAKADPEPKRKVVSSGCVLGLMDVEKVWENCADCGRRVAATIDGGLCGKCAIREEEARRTVSGKVSGLK